MGRKTLIGGCINDADYQLYTGYRARIVCPFYQRWKSMISRCYSPSYLTKHPTYEKTEVSEEFKTFSNFKAWMETQDWEGKVLDKDIAGTNIYSSSSCIFISKELNSLFRDTSKMAGIYPLGVQPREHGFSVSYSRTYLGFFKNVADATKVVQDYRKIRMEELIAKENLEVRKQIKEILDERET